MEEENAGESTSTSETEKMSQELKPETSESTSSTTIPDISEENTSDPSSNPATQESNESSQQEDKSDNTSSKDNYTEHIHYEKNVAIYTDPSTSYQYVWSDDKSEWVPRISKETSEENVDSHQGNYGYDGEQHTYTDADGAIFIWDNEKSAWFPKVDDEFMARYQLSYGINQSEHQAVSTDEKNKSQTKPDDIGDLGKPKHVSGETSKKRAAPQEPTWFDLPKEQNTKVYVTGLPEDITEEEFVELMSKCGLVERDSKTQKMKVKIYMDSNGYPKGDALCTYIRVESVELALNLLDGSDVRGHRISVQRAKFEMKGDYNPALKPKKVRKKDKEKQKKMKEKLFDWRPEKMRGERSKHERVVILRNLFEPKLFDEHVELILEFQQDLREECSKLGEVRRVVLYDRHPEGIAQITMAEPEQADAVVALMNGRWFNKRQLKAEIWDGKTKFKIGETDSEISQRLSGWDKFLEGEENTEKKQDSEKVNS